MPTVAGGKTDLASGFLQGNLFGLPPMQPPSTPAASNPFDFSQYSGYFGNISDMFSTKTITDALGGGSPETVESIKQQGEAAANAGGTWTDIIESFVARLAIIILGLVFVAVGLSMFKGNATTVVQTVKKAI